MAVHTNSALRGGSVLGLRRLGVRYIDPSRLFSPSPQDILLLRAACKKWGIPRFRSWNLLLRALTHSSVSHWAAKRLDVDPACFSPTQLEFLGDRVLAVAAASHGRPGILDNRGFAVVADSAGIVPLLRCPERYATEKSALADAYEAIAGAVYLDGGMDSAQHFVERTLIPHATRAANANKDLGCLHSELVDLVGAFLGRDIVVFVEEYARDRESGPVRGTRVALQCAMSVNRQRAIEGKYILAEARSPKQELARQQALSEALTAVRKISIPEGQDRDDFVRNLLAHGNVKTPNFRDDAERKRRRIVDRVGRGWGYEGYLSRRHVRSCVETSLPSVAAADRADEICNAVEEGLRDVLQKGSISSATLVGQLSALGHALYWLCLTEAAYKAGPEVAKSVLQERVLADNKHRSLLAKRLGGDADRGTPRLIARPGGKLMMYVALGLAYQRLGFEKTFCWLDGGRKLLPQDAAQLSRSGA